ncbi:Ppx/GppA phosphatase family protein [Arcanobacterium ihumii]|uniref:Ppx/GppA phosphatase family protein n=1 Tax=Arcanobacterium ihumii TaxID=2138162 RepID=UPI000F5448B2|nr:Ppx/GppA phosphatase family protein [Arcanobacterium ihumii]
MRVAGIDCGTNSIRLLIADVDPQTRESALTDVVRLMKVVRLGAGVDRTGRFDQEALDRTLKVVDEYAALCKEHGVESIRFAATSATRDAENRQEFIDGIMDRLGIEPQVLTGDEEAKTSFAGAISVLGKSSESPLIAVDLGGGSTEIALGDANGQVISSYSMNVGCVRMHERHLRSDPATEEEIHAARRDVREFLDRAEQVVDFGTAHGVIGLAGSVTTITALALGLDEYDPMKIHGASLTIEEIDCACNWFLKSTAQERTELGFMHPGRVDVINSGALVWQEVVHRLAQRTEEQGHLLSHVVTSEHDILDGLALWAARSPQAPEIIA